MCGTFAILSPDLFTYVYSRIPPGREREFIQKNEGGIRRGVYRQRVRGRKWQWVAKVSSRGEGSSVRMGDGVSHKLEKQPKAAFAPFLKFFTIFFEAPPAVVRVKGHVNDRGKGQFSPPLFPLSFFTESRNVHTRSVYPYPADVCQTVPVFPTYRTVTRALAFASIVLTFANASRIMI